VGGSSQRRIHTPVVVRAAAPSGERTPGG
jgi:hypothetical protein